MKYIVCGCLCLCLSMIGAAQTADTKTVAERYFAALNDHNLDTLAALSADTSLIQSTGFEGIKRGAPGIREIYSRYFTSSPDLHYSIENIVVADSVAVVEYASFGTMTNPEEGIPGYMKGKKYTLKNCTLLTIRDGVIIRNMTYFDQVSYLRQMGYFDKQQ